MLVRVEEEGGLAIGQLSHAWLSGQLARAWGNPRFGYVEPREEVALGAEQHDVGWALFDLEPRLSAATGLPRSFLETSVEEHLTIWRGAPDRLRTQSLHATLVVSMHASALSELRASNAEEPDAAELREHARQERARQEQLRGELGLTPAHAERTQRQMWTWDGLSLALCNAWRPFTSHDVPSAEGLVDVELRDLDDGACTLTPWPFSSPRVRVRCEARRLESRFEDEAAMRDAFARAPALTLEWTFLDAEST